MGLNLPQVQRPGRQTSRPKNDQDDVDPLLERAVREHSPITNVSIKTAYMRGRVAGLAKQDLLQLAQAGVFGWTSPEWAVIREVYALSAQDPVRTGRILRAGISLAEVRELSSRNELTDEALDLLARLRARS